MESAEVSLLLHQNLTADWEKYRHQNGLLHQNGAVLHSPWGSANFVDNLLEASAGTS